MERGKQIKQFCSGSVLIKKAQSILPWAVCLWNLKPVYNIVWGNSTNMPHAGLHLTHYNIDC
jgi:hypothetical protein